MGSDLLQVEPLYGPVLRHCFRTKLAIRAFFLVALACFPKGSPAQSTPGNDSIQAGPIIFAGSLRSRLYEWDWFQPASGENNYQYSGNILRLGLSQNGDRWAWNAEFAVPFLLGLPSTAIGTGPQQGALGLGANYFATNGGNQNTAMIFPKQLYWRFNSLGGNKSHKLQIGRFEFLDGSEVAPKNLTLAVLKRDRVNARLLGNFGFTDVGRSIDLRDLSDLFP